MATVIDFSRQVECEDYKPRSDLSYMDKEICKYLFERGPLYRCELAKPCLCPFFTLEREDVDEKDIE